MPDLKHLADLIENGQVREVDDYTRALLTEGVTPETIVAEGFMPGMYEVGRKFDQQECFITDMLMAARAAKLGYAVIQEWMGTSLPVCKHKVIIGTVRGDLHDIGKNLVATAMRSVGLEVIDLGVDVPSDQFVKAVMADSQVALVAISALLTTTIPAMQETVTALKQCPAASRIRILVGGAPVTPQKAQSMGADVYTDTAFQAANAARDIIREMEETRNEIDNSGGKPCN